MPDGFVEWRTFDQGEPVRIAVSGECRHICHDRSPNGACSLDGQRGYVRVIAEPDSNDGHRYFVASPMSETGGWWRWFAAQELEPIAEDDDDD